MRLNYMFIAAVLIGGPTSSVSAAMQTAQTTTTSGDKAIEDRIEKQIARDKSLKDFSIKVNAENRVVTLTGTVPTEADRAKVAEIAKASGASRVENHIVADLNAAHTKGTSGKIEEKTSDAAAKTKEAGGKTVDKTKEVGGKVVEKTKEGAEKTAEVATDTWITSRIKTKMVGEDVLKDSDVHVSTTDHVVTLTGSVKSAAGRVKAAEIARSVEGVKEIVNKISVR
ncbi:MAG TPA: BON domain-containing protein [Vicinamibacterales bacterium]|nr:BON domain-containing protein [Vicinamibacterales bacterium]